ncbi:MAG: DNA methylase [Eubacteriales bacterium]|nr:DNA methylase [Eubacteriales bacterium]
MKSNTTGSENRIYVCIDLKSFYASVECAERKRDALTTNLVVADESRTDKTICLAVSPALKAFGIPGRPRLFEVVQKVRHINAERLAEAPGHIFRGESDDYDRLMEDPSLKLSYIVAKPRMAFYIKYSTEILRVYLKYVSPDDLVVYSIDEVLIDVTGYLNTYHKTARQFARMLIEDVLKTTGITATAGIGTNLYLAKIAMDVYAKHQPADENGVRIAELNEMSYRMHMWTHQPITDFWRVGRGTAKKLAANGLYTMGDVARCSLGKPGEFYNEDLLYRLFGVNAELLIDHAWGWEPCTIEEIKKYKPKSNSVSSGQVLQEPYENDKARLVTLEMTDAMVMDLVSKELMTDLVSVDIIYDTENLADPARRKYVKGVKADFYGRMAPSPVHGSENFGSHTISGQKINKAIADVFDRITDPHLLIRKIYISAGNLIPSSQAEEEAPLQLSFFDQGQEDEAAEETSSSGPKSDDIDDDRPEKRGYTDLSDKDPEEELKVQQALLSIQKKFGKNAVVKGRDLEDGATAMERNAQIGGHKA